MTRVLYALHGIASYLFFLATFFFAIAFVGNLPAPRTVDSGPYAPWTTAAAVDVLLILAFGMQHSIMARGAFKRAWTRIVPPALERSTYVLFSSLALAALLYFWRPIPQPVLWDVHARWATLAIGAVFWSGWLLVLASSFLINHFELFGLQQIADRAFPADMPAPTLQTPSVYRYVRHPLYLGFLIGFWATPRMTAGHLLLATGMTCYILVGIFFEERDLVATFGERYRDYQRRVGMLLPWSRSGGPL